MMTIIAAVWPYILGGLGILAGLLGVAWGRKTTQTADAQAAAAKAQAGQQVAVQQVAEAQANEDAQKAGSTAVDQRAAIDIEVAAAKPSEVRDELQSWTKP